MLIANSVLAQTTTLVPGYVKKNGTYVAPYYKTQPNNTKLDNFSTKPNVNPYTGKEGTVIVPDPYTAPATTYPKTTELVPVYKETRQATQCMGLTKKGNQCSRMTTNLSGYCFQH